MVTTNFMSITILKIWRNKRLITKRLTLGRLESSEEFKEKKSKVIKKVEDIDGYTRDIFLQNDTLFAVSEDDGLLVYTIKESVNDNNIKK